jgi:hypothetical protein
MDLVLWCDSGLGAILSEKKVSVVALVYFLYVVDWW